MGGGELGWERSPGVYCRMQLSVCVDVSNSLGLVLEEAGTQIDVGLGFCYANGIGEKEGELMNHRVWVEKGINENQ